MPEDKKPFLPEDAVKRIVEAANKEGRVNTAFRSIFSKELKGAGIGETGENLKLLSDQLFSSPLLNRNGENVLTGLGLVNPNKSRQEGVNPDAGFVASVLDRLGVSGKPPISGGRGGGGGRGGR